MATVTEHDEQEQEEVVEVGTLDLLAPDSAMALDRAAIDMQVATAKQYPREMTKVLREAKGLACADQETAESMFYVLRRSGKKIQGPSARLAEIMLYAWGNARAEADIVSQDRKWVTAMGTCFDLERNVAVRIRVKRRITDKHGKTYNDDMIGVTSNAAVSIAFRNAVLKCIPRSFTDRIYRAAQAAAVGKGDLGAQRTKALDFFAKAGKKPEEVYAYLGIAGLDDMGIEEIIELRGLATAIKDGDTTLEMAFTPQRETQEAEDLDRAIVEATGE